MNSVKLNTFGAHQAWTMARMALERNTKFDQASTAAANKGLLVVGGPFGSAISGGLFGIKAHGCGDVCADLDARACKGCRWVPSDIRRLPFGHRQFGAAFCAHVLEHMPSAADCARAWAQLHRVADRVFVCVPGSDSLFAALVPDHHLWVRELDGSRLLVLERFRRRLPRIGEGDPQFVIEASGAFRPV